MDVSETEAINGKSDQVTTGDKINEVMDVDTDSSNSLRIALADAKSSDPTDSKLSNENDDNISADENSMVIDETNINPEEETSSKPQLQKKKLTTNHIGIYKILISS